MSRVAIPAIIAMVVVAAFVGTGGWNESHPPRLTIALTERELQLLRTPTSDGDEPGLQMQLAYEYRHEPLDARNWLPESRLREIGFDLTVPAGSQQARDVYRHIPSRLAWVAFEYDGPLWRDIERRRALREPSEPVERHPMLHSRLVPVDAAPEFEALRVRYPAGHLIVRAVIRLAYTPTPAGGGILHGALREVVPQRVAVPQQFRGLLNGLSPSVSSGAPRYEAELAIGRLGFPYLRSVRLLKPAS